jgi:hypothetical protein
MKIETKVETKIETKIEAKMNGNANQDKPLRPHPHHSVPFALEALDIIYYTGATSHEPRATSHEPRATSHVQCGVNALRKEFFLSY